MDRTAPIALALSLLASLSFALQPLSRDAGGADYSQPGPRASITHTIEGGCFLADGWDVNSDYAGSFAIPQFDSTLGTLVGVEVETFAECGWTTKGKVVGTSCTGENWRLAMPRAENFALGEVRLASRLLDGSDVQKIPATLSGATQPASSGTPCDWLDPAGVITLQQSVTALSDGSTTHTDRPLLTAVTGTGTVTFDLSGHRQVWTTQYIPCASMSSCTDLWSQACFTGATGGAWQLQVAVTYHYEPSLIASPPARAPLGLGRSSEL